MARRGKDIEAAAAYVRLYVNGSAFVKGLKSAGEGVDKLAAKMRGFGKNLTLATTAFTAPAIAGLKKYYVDLGSELDDAAQRTGFLVSGLSALKFAAELSGASFEDLEKSLRKGKVTNVEKFLQISERISQLKNPAAQISKAMATFGKSGAQLVPLLKDGAKGINELIMKAKELGLIFDTKAVQKAAAIGDKLDYAFKTFSKVIFEIGSALEPVIGPALERVVGAFVNLSDWIQKNQKEVREFAIAFAKIAGAAFLVAGVAVTAGLALQFVAGVITSLAIVLGGVVATFGFLISPMGRVTLLAAGLGKLVVDLIPSFKLLRSVAVDTWNGISNAFRGGNIQLAVKILKEGFLAAFASIEIAFRNAWPKILDFATNLWEAFLKNMVGALASVLESLPALLGGGKANADALIKKQEEAAAARQEARGKARPADPKVAALEAQLKERIDTLDKLIKEAEFLPDAARKELPNAKTALPDFEADNNKPSGTFNPFALRSLGAVGPAERTAKATEKTAKNTQKLALLTFH